MIKTPKIIGSAMRSFALALVALVVSSCQTEPTEVPASSTYSATIPKIDSSYQPDRASWKVGKDSGAQAIKGSGSVVQISLSTRPADPVWIELSRMGIRIMRVKFVLKTGTTLEFSGDPSDVSKDLIAMEIFRRIHPSKDTNAFNKKFAELLVENDSLVVGLGFPTKSLVGVDNEKVLDEAMKLLVASGKKLDDWNVADTSWALGISEAKVHERVKALVAKGAIVADTNKLFPPPPMRVKTDISMPTQVQAGGSAVDVAGIFEATTKIATMVVKVLQDTVDATRGFEIPSIDLTSRPQVLELSGKLSFSAKATTTPGSYKLVIVVQDDAGHTVRATFSFEVLSQADKQGPSIEILEPAANTVLENDVATIAVKAKVQDPSGVDSVWISDKLATQAAGVWSVSAVEIPVTDIGYAVVVRAKDAKGNVSTKDILVGRKGKVDPGAPTWQVLQPKANEVFPFDSASVLVRWKVADPRAAIAKAVIGGGDATKDADGVWSRRVNLPPTGAATTITLLATNANGQEVQGFVQVTRQPDAVGPAISIKSPVDGTGFGYDVQTVLVKVAAIDPSGVDSVKVNGMRAETVATEFVYTLAMEPGKTIPVKVEAWDKLKNRSVDSIAVSRKGPPDTSAPRIRLVAPATSGQTVGLETSTFTLKWLVTDLFGVNDTGVKIEGRQALRSKDTFSLVVPVPLPGKEQSYRIEVVNIKGVWNYETAILKRAADIAGPTILRLDSGRTVAFEVDKANVTWKVSDNYRLASVVIAGKAIAGVDGVYSYLAPLAIGANPVGILATDSAGNRSVDSVVIQRTWKDTSKPTLVRQAGTENKNVAFGTTEFAAAWKVTDNALSEVKINGTKITGVDDVFGYKATLAGDSTRIKIEAIDVAGNASVDSITIKRSSDTTDPVLTRLAGTKDTVLAYATASYGLGWKVVDENAIRSVSIGGVAATKTGDEYKAVVALPKPGSFGFKVVAVDAAGNETTDSVTIRRSYHDSIKPVVVRSANTKDQTVSNATDKLALSWSVTDNDQVKSVTIAGGVASVSGSTYSRTVDLVLGANPVVLIVLDTANNETRDTVTITRTMDGGAPTIVRQSGTKDSAVVYLTTSINLAWKITDDVGVTSVTINGAPATGSAGLYALTLSGLKVGANGVKVVAKDASGKQSTDTLTITRAWKDTIAPVVVRQTGTGPKAVDYATTSVALAWTVADSLLDKVTIQGVAKTAAAGVYSANVALAVGSNPITLLATDKQGNVTKDEFVVVRNAPAPVHGAVAGTYIGTLYDTIKSPGAESIEYSIDGINWQKTTNGVAAVRTSGTFDLLARSLPGEATTKIRVTMRQIKTVKTRGGFSWFVMEDGSAWAAGENYDGQLGDNSTTASPAAKQVLTDVSDVALGGGYTLFLKKDGTVWGTGSDNYYGQLCGVTAGATIKTPVQISSGYKAIEAGTTTSFFQRSLDSRWYACGANSNGELGTAYLSEKNNFAYPITLTDVTSISAGHMFTLFFKPNGEVWGSGNNGYGPMPIIDGTSPDDQVPSLRYASAIGASTSGHSLLINPDKTVSRFGGNSRLGGTTGIANAKAVGAGQLISVFLVSNGGVYISGELSGVESYRDPIKFMDGGAKIAVGNATVFVVKTDGTLWGYGDNSSGSFGIGADRTGQYNAPYQINF